MKTILSMLYILIVGKSFFFLLKFDYLNVSNNTAAVSRQGSVFVNNQRKEKYRIKPLVTARPTFLREDIDLLSETVNILTHCLHLLKGKFSFSKIFQIKMLFLSSNEVR